MTQASMFAFDRRAALTRCRCHFRDGSKCAM